MSDNGQGNLFEDADIEPDNEADPLSDKVLHEIHRMMGFLRFSPDTHGVYTASCEPDYFILPALGPHFQERFGKTPWAIIDEKRRLCLRCLNGSLEFFEMDKGGTLGGTPIKDPSGGGSPDDEWENLWRLYHKTINNESRNNPGLQRQFMPKRYWKYLTELN